jgi:hypothetical protein
MTQEKLRARSVEAVRHYGRVLRGADQVVEAIFNFYEKREPEVLLNL